MNRWVAKWTLPAGRSATTGEIPRRALACTILRPPHELQPTTAWAGLRAIDEGVPIAKGSDTPRCRANGR